MALTTDSESGNEHAEARRWMQQVISDMLHDAEAEARLADLLVGTGLPPVGHAEEPYVWIVRGVPRGAACFQTESRLGYLLGRILAAARPGEPARTYNALRLAACLSAPDYLCEPLFTLYSARTLADEEYRGIPLAEALRSAIIENQLDDRYRAMWREMYDKQGDEHLGGTPTSGFDGVLWMPPRASERGTPDFSEIGFALGAIARDLQEYEPPSRWRPEFQLHIDRARAAYPNEAWPLELLQSAHAAMWPSWAVEALPELCGVFLGRQDSGQQRIAVWSLFAAFVHETPVIERWCGGKVLVCDVPPKKAESITRTLRPIDAARAQHDLVSEKSMLGALAPEVARRIPSASADAQFALMAIHELCTTTINVGSGRPSVPRRSTPKGQYSS